MFAKLQSYKWPLTVGFVLLILNGVWQLAGAPTYLIKGGYFVFLLFYCFVLLLQAKMKMAIDGLVQIYIICLFFVVMNLLYPFQTLSVSFFQLFSPIILFYLLTFSLGNLAHDKAHSFINLVIISQVIAMILKLLLYGQEEGLGIGTMSIQAGSLSTFIVFFISVLAIERKTNGFLLHCVMLFCFAGLFAVVNEKRLGILIVSSLIFLAALTPTKETLSNRKLPFKFKFFAVRLGVGGVLGLCILLLGQYFVPTLFEGYTLFTLSTRIETYLFATHSDGRPIGRLAGALSLIHQLQANNSLWLGFGPMSFFSSGFFQIDNAQQLFRASGLVIVLGRFGLLGLSIFAIFFLALFKRAKHNFIAQMLIAYLVLDFVFYSDTLFVSHACILLLFVLLAIQKNTALREQNDKYL